MKLILKEKTQNAKDVFSFKFNPQQHFDWVPGQYVQVVLPHKNPDNRGIKRFFSIASAPQEKIIMITTRIMEEGGSTFKARLMELKPGAFMEASKPRGDFKVADADKRQVMIAGGIGITPFRSILLDLDYRHKLKDIILLYASRDNPPIFYEELEKLDKKNKGFKLIIPEVTLDSGVIAREIGDLKDTLYMVSGPAGMVKALGQQLEGLGVEPQNIKKDFFPGYD